MGPQDGKIPSPYHTVRYIHTYTHTNISYGNLLWKSDHIVLELEYVVREEISVQSKVNLTQRGDTKEITLQS